MVVAPITWKSPLASDGFKMFAASALPSAEPAPTMVWSSSIKRIVSFDFLTSSIAVSYTHLDVYKRQALHRGT